MQEKIWTLSYTILLLIWVMRAGFSQPWHILTGNLSLRCKGLWVKAWFHFKAHQAAGGQTDDRETEKVVQNSTMGDHLNWGLKTTPCWGPWCYHGQQVLWEVSHASTAGDIQKLKASVNSRPPFDVHNKTNSFMRMRRMGSQWGYSTKLHFRCHARWAWAKDVVLMVCREREQAETAEG